MLNRGVRGRAKAFCAGGAVALFLALGGPAVAAKGLIGARDIATGAVTSKAIKNGAVNPSDLSRSAKRSLNGVDGRSGVDGRPGVNGANGANGPNGPDGTDGADGADGIDGTNGTNGLAGTNGLNGADGVLAPRSAAAAGPTALPTATPPTVVVSLDRTRGQLRGVREDAADPQRGRRHGGLRAQGRRHRDRPGRDEDAPRARSTSGFTAGGDHHIADTAESRVRRDDRQRLGQLQQPDRAPDRLGAPGETPLKPTIGLEPMTPSLPWKCSTN